MDWLGGLSNIRGQLSTITKDLLTEGAGELTDAQSQLELANQQIGELQSIVDAQKLEIVALKREKDELEVQLESTQLRLDHAREQFSASLAEKDTVIQKLRAHVATERGEPEGQSASVVKSVGQGPHDSYLSTDFEATLGSPGSTSENYVTEGAGNIGTATWQELRNEVAQLRAEANKWRRIAKQRRDKGKKTSPVPDTFDLEHEIDDLKQRLLELDETRQVELAALRDTHSEHMNSMMEQLRDAESEIMTLRTQLAEATTHATNPVTVSQAPEVDTTLPSIRDEQSVNKKKGRGAKKKKSKPCTAEPEVKVTTVSTSLPTSPDHLPSEQYVDSSVQTEENLTLIEPTVDTAKMDSSNPSSNNVESQTDFQNASIGIQASSELLSVEVQASPLSSMSPPLVIDKCSVQVDSTSTTLNLPTDSPQTGQSLISDDHCSQTSEVSDVSTYSRQLEELLLQLSEEVKSYERALGDVVTAAVSRFTPNTYSDDVDVDGSLVGLVDGSLPDSSEISRKLHILQNSLNSRRKRLAALRKAHHRKTTLSGETTQSSKGSNTSVRSDDVLVVSRVAVSEQSALAEVNDITEPEVDGWQEDDFPEFDSNPSDGDTSEGIRKTGSLPPHNGDKGIQTSSVTDLQNALVVELQKTVCELETRLQSESSNYQNRIEELESDLKPARKMESLLNQIVEQLTAILPPPPFPPKRMGSPPISGSTTWPPKDPESQLSFLVNAEAAARNELGKLHFALADAQNTIDRLQAQLDESKQTQPIAADYSDATGNEEVEVNPCSLAYKLCLALDEEYCQTNWDADQWDAILYELLKPRFADNSASAEEESSDERVVQLSAEVAALRHILDQHNTFRSQAEHDLRQLLSTVSSQREKIQSLTTEKEKLEADISNANGSVNSRQTESDDLSRTAIQQLSELVRSKEEEVDMLRRRCDDLTELVRSTYRHVGPESDADHGSVSDAGDDDVVKIMERLVNDLSGAKSRAELAEGMYESAVSALQHKHAESQAYHAELQRVCAELSLAQERNQSLLQETGRLRETISELQTEVGQLKDISNAAQRTDNLLDNESGINTDLTAGGTVASTGTHSSESLPTTAELTSNEAKLLSELTRLQAHLLEMEETYTAEALSAESREVDLRNRLQEAESRLQQLEESGRTSGDQVQRYQAERDEARADAAEYRKEVSALRVSLNNLQSALDSFQKNQQTTIHTETEHIRMELQRARQREQDALGDVNRLKDELSDRSELEGRARSLESQIQQHAFQINQLKEQITYKDSQIDALKTRLAQMAVDTDSKVDKVLIRNLLVSFFQLPSAQRSNGLKVIGSLLNFSEEDYTKVGSDSGALPRLFGWVRNAVSSLPSGPPKDVTLSSTYPDKSFTELLLAFLEQETGSSTPLRLSMDHYTPDAVRPSAHRRQVHTARHESPPISPMSHGISSNASQRPEVDSGGNRTLSSSAVSRPNGSSTVPKNPLYI